MEASFTIVVFILLVAGTVFWVWALVDVVSGASGPYRRGSQLLWVAVIALTHSIGAAAYVLFGRPRRRGALGPRPSR